MKRLDTNDPEHQALALKCWQVMRKESVDLVFDHFIFQACQVANGPQLANLTLGPFEMHTAMHISSRKMSHEAFASRWKIQTGLAGMDE